MCFNKFNLSLEDKLKTKIYNDSYSYKKYLEDKFIMEKQNMELIKKSVLSKKEMLYDLPFVNFYYCLDVLSSEAIKIVLIYNKYEDNQLLLLINYFILNEEFLYICYILELQKIKDENLFILIPLADLLISNTILITLIKNQSFSIEFLDYLLFINNKIETFLTIFKCQKINKEFLLSYKDDYDLQILYQLTNIKYTDNIKYLDEIKF